MQVNARDAAGREPLHIAAYHGHELLVVGLLAVQNDPHARNLIPTHIIYGTTIVTDQCCCGSEIILSGSDFLGNFGSGRITDPT